MEKELGGRVRAGGAISGGVGAGRPRRMAPRRLRVPEAGVRKMHMSKRLFWCLTALFAVCCCTNAASAQSGACCYGNGNCFELSQAICVDSGGQFQGVGVKCGDITCVPFGVCCFSDQSRCHVATQPECIALHGRYQGDLPKGETADCDDAGGEFFCREDDLHGACCLPDGSCRDVTDIGPMESANAAACRDLGGVYQGSGTLCDDVSCAGACCFGDCSCDEGLLWLACQESGGVFQGVGSVCSTQQQAEHASSLNPETEVSKPVRGAPLPPALCPSVAITQTFQQEQNFVLPLFFPQFNEDVECGELTRVLVVIDAEITTVVIGCNLLTTKSQLTEVTYNELVTAEVAPPNFPGDCGQPILTVIEEPPFPQIGMMQCDPPLLPPGECCDLGSSEFGSPIQFEGDATCEYTGDLMPFLGAGTFEVRINGAGEFGTTISNFSLTNTPHTVSGTVTVIYQYQPCGACCQTDGTCAQSTEADCLAAGGEFLGCGSTCDPNGFGIAACCLPGGTCIETTEPCCEAQGGTFYPGEVCATPVACCLPDGSCQDLSPVCCAQQGGTSGNEQCGDLGACCLPDDSCDELFEDCCELAGGTFTPGGVCLPPVACCFTNGTCQNLSPVCCEQDGGTPGDEPCDVIGACCLPDDSCDELFEECCELVGGTFSPGEVCDPPIACCFTDGTCENLSPVCCEQDGGTPGDEACGVPGACCLPNGTCDELFAACCELVGGTFTPGAICGTDVACCLPDGSCEVMAEACCIQAGGGFTIGVDDCGSLPGACCIAGQCQELFEACCEKISGAVFLGAGVPCGEQDGACCIGDSCVIMDEACCVDSGGTFVGGPCPAPVACCLPGGDCEDISPVCCALQGGTPGDEPCGVTGACCFDDGTCEVLFEECCEIAAGEFLPGEVCVPAGACCFADGTCEVLSEACCVADGGSFTAAGVACVPNPCIGACCVMDPADPCIEVTLEGCAAAGGIFQGPATTCAGVECPGACCLPDGTCVENVTLDECVALGGSAGTYHPLVGCDPNPCLSRGGCSEKGSLLFWSKVELRWDLANVLKQDTFVTLNNDFGAPVRVKMFFVDGDTWEFLNVAILMTANEPIYWRASTGMPQTVPPFTSLGPGQIVGNERVLRGYIVGWAVNTLNQEIRWNHLSGGATIVNFAEGWAWEYTSCAFKALGVAHGAQTGDPGIINLDGLEFDTCGQFLLYDFWADAQPVFNVGGVAAVNVQDLTLHPVSIDLRQDNDGPVITKADVNIWNENEFKVSGTSRCIFCWDQALLSEWGTGFAISNIQTDKARARIDGVAHNNEISGPSCFVDFLPGNGPIGTDPRDLLSIDAALLGLSTKFLTFGAGVTPDAAAGTHLVWTGQQAAVIQYATQSAPPPESNTPPELQKLLNEFDDFVRGRMNGSSNVRE